MTISASDRIKFIRRRILITAGEISKYNKNWGPEYCVNSIVEATSPERSTFMRAVEPITQEDINSLSKEELLEFGFGIWDEDSVDEAGRGSYLIPIYLVNFLHPDLEVATFGKGDKATVKDITDFDHRFGCLASSIFKK